MTPSVQKVTATKRRKRGPKNFAVATEDEKVKKQLEAKFGRTRTRNSREAVVGPMLRAEKSMQIENSGQHDMLISRAEEAQSSRMTGVESHPGHLDGAWRCALCQQKSLQGNLGDLFGPYFVRLSPDHWPTFLVKKPTTKLARNANLWLDFWLHGDCALWAPEVYMVANRLQGLQEHINEFWSQHCSACGKEGATIAVGEKGKFMHFPCAEQKGHAMDQSLLLCRPAISSSSSSSSGMRSTNKK